MFGQVLVKIKKSNIQIFTENMIKGLFGSIMEKHLKEMEIMGRKTLS